MCVLFVTVPPCDSGDVLTGRQLRAASLAVGLLYGAVLISSVVH